ncbi:villin-1-like [Neocloeon triangulifer]|uniref:villin-1-like n=1 Tax=Neocloeon triangulifer TaxID=2078957 RepID=UPI00286F8070|nr:villin-1-like [Neocloeon triangulifer]XP_059489817.1 villin-1-like [Neocloeon triangulifer]XP_059489826.1 villin-1-like [Neocloeon triangulifer]XP_059489834.1 villin-1-like [Neocloeon triangulifer]
MSGNNAANVDPAFATIPRASTGLYIWRIENLKVVPLPRDQYGHFYEGDSYIVYAASEYGKPATVDMKPSPVKGSPEIHLHFWLGLETTQDEAGVAAYKTVELDDLLGGGPVQHREVEGQETPRFKGYFTKGMRMMKGGVSSGFKKTTDNFTPRLFRVKGRRSPAMTEMPAISWSNMNSGDCFIIDTKNIVFVWTGKAANKMEKLAAAKMAQQLKVEHEATGVVFIEEGGEMSLPEVERKILSVYLDPKNAREVAPATEDENDAAAESAARQQLRLYHCSDDSGTLKVTEVKSGPLDQSDLSSNDSYIVDNGSNGIWVWVGKKASPKERVEAMRNAHGFVKKKGYPSHTAVTRVIDGGEPVDFKQLFTSWKNKDQTSPTGMLNKPNSTNRIARSISTVFDATSLHERPQMAAETQLVDDGTGHQELWRVRKFGLETVDPKFEGIFFSGDCYILKYTYLNGSKEQYILYYWMGLESSQDEQGTAALKVIEKDQELGGAAVQVRVTQGKEPPHFLSLFAGRFMIISGGYASSFDEDDPSKKQRDWVIPEEYMLQVYGNSKTNTRATQVPFRASSLNTNDVFVIKSKSGLYIWCGKGSTGDEREMGKGVAKKVGASDHIFVSEGQEKPEFWEMLGGKEAYADSKRLSDASDAMPARLFQCSNASGQFKAEEIVNFAQTDLIQEDVMLLDANECIFIWIGKDSRKDEQKATLELAMQYLKTDPSGRGTGTPFIQIKQGYEPPNFTGFFGTWNPALWSENKSFEEMKAEMISQNGVIKLDMGAANGKTSFDDYPKYPLSVLLEKDAEKLPEDVDAMNKELHLNKEEFQQVFGMDISAFEGLPQWRRANLKKQAGIF